MNEIKFKPDYLFEVSWEVCNKIGGIHTVLSTRAMNLVRQLGENYFVVGPDVWKETHGNPEFAEDRFLFRSWREQAEKDGIHIRIGRWQVPGEPIAMLVDFTPYFGEKDKIFTDLWLKFGVNSLNSQWDYTEPALFGYAAGKLMEHFYEYHMTASDRFAAVFHSWKSGTGILYLKEKVPQAATVFATHATAIGRALAASGKAQPFLAESTADPETLAAKLGISSRHSLEKCAATQADVFITVSEHLADECLTLLERKPDLIAPNGFDPGVMPGLDDFPLKRKKSRDLLLSVARGLLNQDIPEHALLVAHSGRYEFENKGMDVFIDALAKTRDAGMKLPVVVFLLIPTVQGDPRAEVITRIASADFNNPIEDEYLTHKLADETTDPILNHLKQKGIRNTKDSLLKVIYVPAQLDGHDGVINTSYYDLLIGFDLTVFPSVYEPWGYTPMESLAFHIPTISSAQSGFGQWLRSQGIQTGEAISLLDDINQRENAAAALGKLLQRWLDDAEAGQLLPPEAGTNAYSHKHMSQARNRAAEISGELSWEKMIFPLHEALALSLEKARGREDLYKGKKQPAKLFESPDAEAFQPKWKKLTVEMRMPEAFRDLPELTRNLWWTWNPDAAALFESMDARRWEKSKQNPNIMLESLSIEDFETLQADESFMKAYHEVLKRFRAYMAGKSNARQGQIAYFSMEYGLHESIKIYSGGLGVLAGDFLKQASDDNVDMIGIGLLYRYGYFSQSLSVSGDQLAQYTPHHFPEMSAIPVRDENGKWVKISIAFPGRTLHARVWRIDVGRIPLFLLDTDINENASVDRFITHQLYGGDWENRFKQEFVLGIGGIRLLDALGIRPDIFHCNEGHAAFTGLERMRKYVQEEKLSFEEALEVVRSSSLFTTHTPVPAGHDFFSEDMLRTYMPHYAERLGISWNTFMSLGKMNPAKAEESYSMSVLAAKLAQRVNGVSKIHGKVSRDMFRDLYPGYFADEIHIGHVTNGVHYGTWTDRQWQDLYRDTFGEDFQQDISNPRVWERIYEVPDERIWEIRKQQRIKLLEYMKKRLLRNLSRRQETPRKIYQMLDAIDENALTIGFARRFATYKRARLLFNDLDRLARIVNNKEMPVQFIYAGKAHPADKAGQELIRHIVEISKQKEFRGKIIFLEDYDMELGSALTRGVDIWLNTPTRPLEASGTSGQKAVLNGVLNLSVLDGWWAEGYTPEAGWALKEERTYDNQSFQDELDAETIYNMLESEIAGMFYERNEKGIPEKWVRWIKNNIARIAPHYTNKRMMDDYFRFFYDKLLISAREYRSEDYRLARDISRWKNRLIRGWDSIEVRSKKLLNGSGKTLLLGESFQAEIDVDLNELKPEDVGAEVVFSQKTLEGENERLSVYPMQVLRTEKKLVTFSCDIPARHTGAYNYAFRMFPKNPNLPHRQDIGLIKWL